MLYPCAVISYLKFLPLVKVFLPVDSCSNWYFWEGMSARNSCTALLHHHSLWSIFVFQFREIVPTNPSILKEFLFLLSPEHRIMVLQLWKQIV